MHSETIFVYYINKTILHKHIVHTLTDSAKNWQTLLVIIIQADTNFYLNALRFKIHIGFYFRVSCAIVRTE